jgi:putative addiction module component (TIGR02574 family)
MLDPVNILQEALKLPPEARAELAASLLDSLDDRVDPDAQAMWDQEIRRRLEEIDRGQVRMVPWTEARKTIAKQLTMRVVLHPGAVAEVAAAHD